MKMFTLFVRLYTKAHDPRVITINAYDMEPARDSAGRVRLTCEVKHGTDVIFPKGQLYCALHTKDPRGMAARELIMALVSMRPGDTDRDYFRDYTPAQLAWSREHGESLSMERNDRYCDESGECRA